MTDAEPEKFLAELEEKKKLIEEEIKKIYFYTGFRKAIREIYYNMSEDDEKKAFKVILYKILKDKNLVELYTGKNDNNGCPPGQCPDGMGGCVDCLFPSENS